MKFRITLVNRINQPGNVCDVEINEVLAMIKNGVCYNQDLREVTAFIQSQSNHDVQNQLKLQNFPVALFNGTFSYKNSAGLKEYSNFTESTLTVSITSKSLTKLVAVFAIPRASMQYSGLQAVED